ncbi:ATP-binding protein [Asanoa siamensis]|uniref:LuxR family transcriptional regulator n=1 Tax=Asanoa siamensis TaxID=926357 RepID=A0ABQ4CRJ4_9ACTN|nr:AAA family ATPase [Asanoa siamensis]GIF73907.1 LuxR family transcriptional regulator [Asanoa siamensis]
MTESQIPSRPIGRHAERDRLRRLIGDLSAGRGRAILIEGEPGIGKTSLVRAATADARGGGAIRVIWAVCDELSQAFPLLPLLEALDGCPGVPEAERQQIVQLLRSDMGVGNRVDVIPAAAEQLLALIDNLCAAAPTMLVVDDLQWADPATVLTIARLVRCLDQLPLLIVGLTRTIPRRDDVVALRRAIEPEVVRLENLDGTEVQEFVGELVGGAPGPRLAELAAGAAGNPLYLTELVDVLVRAGALAHLDDCVEAEETSTPGSLSGAISDRLEFLPPHAREVLRVAALLGIDFSVRELAVVSGRRVPELLPILDEAILAGVVVENGSEMAFRHPLIRDCLYDSMPAAVRAAWHRDAARALADDGAPAERVARQLRPTVEEDDTGGTVDTWVVGWLTENAPRLVGQAPKVAIPMLRWALSGTPPGAGSHDVLASRLADALYRVGDPSGAAEVATAALVEVKRPDALVELLWTLTQCQALAGRTQESLDPLKRALKMPGIGLHHRARLLVLIARAHRTLGRVDAAAKVAEEALATATEAGDRWGMGWALLVQTIVHGMRGESRKALPLYDRALAVSEGDPSLADLRLLLQINQAIALGVLDRYEEAIQVAETVRQSADRAGNVFRLAQAQTALSELLFDNGKWDDALVEIDLAIGVSKNPLVDCAQHGLAATIQLHRGTGESERHLLAADHFNDRVGGRTCRAFAMAKSLQREREDDPAAALQVLLDLLSSVQDDEETVDLLADAVRLAMTVDDKPLAATIVARAVAFGEGSPVPHRRAVALHCQSLLANDPAGLLEAANGYRAAGRPLPRAQALEAAALALAERGALTEARNLFTDAYSLYAKLGAEWDLLRTQARFRSFGIRRGPRVRHRQARRGWDSLTPTEIKVAGLVAQGMSNPAIAAQLFLSRRTVQTHVSHILAKLELGSRIDIAREASQRAHTVT